MKGFLIGMMLLMSNLILGQSTNVPHRVYASGSFLVFSRLSGGDTYYANPRSVTIVPYTNTVLIKVDNRSWELSAFNILDINSIPYSNTVSGAIDGIVIVASSIIGSGGGGGGASVVNAADSSKYRSQIGAKQIGLWNVNIGSNGSVNGTIGNAGFFKITDGVGTAGVFSGVPVFGLNGLGTKAIPNDAAGNTQTVGATPGTAANVKLTDGINNVDVKQANTPATASDKALVVALSPNNPLTSAPAPDNSITSIAGSVLNTDLITGDFSQYKSLKFTISGTFVAGWTVHFSNDPSFTNIIGGLMYNLNSASYTAANGTAGGTFFLPMEQGSYVRIRITSYTSGSVVANVNGSYSSNGLQLTENAFVSRIPTNGQKVSSGSLPVVLPSNSTVDIQKEWKVVVATGTPIANPKEILIQTIRNNGGTVSVTWFNMTTSSILTVAPVIANLFNRSLAFTQDGREEFALYTPNIVAITTQGGIQGSVYSVRQGNQAILTSQAGFTVPVGKTLRITSMEMQGYQASVINANNDGSIDFSVVYDYAGVIPTATSAKGISVSGRWMWIPAGTNANNSATQGHNSIPDGSFELPAGAVIRIAHQQFNWGGTGHQLMVKGYLYNN